MIQQGPELIIHQPKEVMDNMNGTFKKPLFIFFEFSFTQTDKNRLVH